jgi:hypothetical protein
VGLWGPGSVGSVGAALAQIQRGLDRGHGSTLCVRGSMWGARESVTWGARGSIMRTRSVARGWAGPIGWLGGLGDE